MKKPTPALTDTMKLEAVQAMADALARTGNLDVDRRRAAAASETLTLLRKLFPAQVQAGLLDLMFDGVAKIADLPPDNEVHFGGNYTPTRTELRNFTLVAIALVIHRRTGLSITKCRKRVVKWYGSDVSGETLRRWSADKKHSDVLEMAVDQQERAFRDVSNQKLEVVAEQSVKALASRLKTGRKAC